jgi:hypothetical protein
MNPFFNQNMANWAQLQNLPNKKFICGFCSTNVSSIRGFKLGQQTDGSGQQIGAVYICPNCGGPVFFDSQSRKYPSPTLGNSVQHVPETLNVLYEEARRCSGQN